MKLLIIQFIAKSLINVGLYFIVWSDDGSRDKNLFLKRHITAPSEITLTCSPLISMS
jgi:hypothetical protein